MTRTADNRGHADEGASNPPPPPSNVDPTGLLEVFIWRMERVTDNLDNLEANCNNNHGRARQWQNEDKLLERFRALRPEKFDGMSEGWKAEQWLREIDWIFETMDCTELDKHRLATFQLTDAAVDW